MKGLCLPLSGGKGHWERRRASAYGQKETKRKRHREGGDSRLDHMTQSIVILSEKGLERSISPSGRGKKKGETDGKTATEMERKRGSNAAREQTERE